MKTARMSKTPVWPGGNEPDRITDIKGGFRDGIGLPFPAPPGMTAVFKRDGRWTWAEADPVGDV